MFDVYTLQCFDIFDIRDDIALQRRSLYNDEYITSEVIVFFDKEDKMILTLDDSCDVLQT